MGIIVNGNQIGGIVISGEQIAKCYLNGEVIWPAEKDVFSYTITTTTDAFTYKMPAGATDGLPLRWIIKWGDGQTSTVDTTTTANAWIEHTYALAGNYIIKIRPIEYALGWLLPFAHQDYTDISVSSQGCITNFLTPVDISSVMTSTTTIGANCFERAFQDCANLQSTFYFSNLYGLLPTTSYKNFLYATFHQSGAKSANDDFVMHPLFNIPQTLTLVNGDNFMSYAFHGQYGSSFTMNDIFALPTGFKWQKMSSSYCFNYTFGNCYGDAFNMNNIFTMPKIHDATSTGDRGGLEMFKNTFRNCHGANFTMGENFGFPIFSSTSGRINYNCFQNMFMDCYGPAFTMNDTFTLDTIKTYLNYQEAHGVFANMFYGCKYGDGYAFNINSVFKLPNISSSYYYNRNTPLIFDHMFYLTASENGVPTPIGRTATSIINGNAAPASSRAVFGPDASVWSDYASLANYWKN